MVLPIAKFLLYGFYKQVQCICPVLSSSYQYLPSSTVFYQCHTTLLYIQETINPKIILLACAVLFTASILKKIPVLQRFYFYLACSDIITLGSNRSVKLLYVIIHLVASLPISNYDRWRDINTPNIATISPVATSIVFLL